MPMPLPSPSRPTPPRPQPKVRRQRAARKAATPGTGFSLRSRHCFLAVIFAVAQMVFFCSSLFQVQDINVEGLDTLSPGLVRKATGIRKGDYIWKTLPGTLAGRVLQLQNVAQAEVSYMLPGQVMVAVRERQPVCQVAANTLHPTWYAVDSSGLVLRKLNGTSNQLPRLKLEEQIEVGKRLHPALIATCSQACGKIEQEFPSSVWYYTLDQRGNLSFRTFSHHYPVDVQLGNLDRLDYKLEVLRALMNSVMQKQQVAGVDLRFPTPVVRLLHPPKVEQKAETNPT